SQHARAKLLLALLPPLDGLLPLLLARSGRSVGLELTEELKRDPGDVIDGVLARLLVRLRERPEAAQLAHVLQRGCANFLFGRGGLEVMEGLDVPAHGPTITRLQRRARRKSCAASRAAL